VTDRTGYMGSTFRPGGRLTTLWSSLSENRPSSGDGRTGAVDRSTNYQGLPQDPSLLVALIDIGRSTSRNTTH
jgi:hypothetical protein